MDCALGSGDIGRGGSGPAGLGQRLARYDQPRRHDRPGRGADAQFANDTEQHIGGFAIEVGARRDVADRVLGRRFGRRLDRRAGADEADRVRYSMIGCSTLWFFTSEIRAVTFALHLTPVPVTMPSLIAASAGRGPSPCSGRPKRGGMPRGGLRHLCPLRFPGRSLS